MEKVLWTKGVLLSPQHLQTQDRFLEDLVGFQLASLSFCPWGFARLEIDREALAGGMLALSEAAGLLPDGLPFDMPLSDATPEPKPLEEFWPVDASSLDVFLTIPEQRAGGNNVSITAADRGTRFLAEVILRRDENTGLAEKPIQVARKNFRLLAEVENLDGSAALPVARVVRAASGEFALDPHFVPPVLDIAASEYLMSLARRLVEILSAKSAALSGTRRQRNQGLADFGVSDVANFWLLYTVNAHLPRFRHLFETRRGHPAVLYDVMAALAGSLTTFSTTIHPRDLPAYDHSNLGECFGRLDTIVRELLETVVPASHVALPLKQMEPSIHATAIEHDRYLAAPALYLAVAAAARPEQIARDAPRLLKVSSGNQLPRLIRQALPGVTLRPLVAPPSALPVKLDFHYFALDKAGADWDAITLERNLAVYVPSEFPEARLELVVMLPRGG
ncbi:MAG: type VI secretion system baseplate subunit TssK [Longimicrobiales bacterium]